MFLETILHPEQYCKLRLQSGRIWHVGRIGVRILHFCGPDPVGSTQAHTQAPLSQAECHTQAIWQPQQVIWWTKLVLQRQAEAFGMEPSQEPGSFFCLEQLLFLEVKERRLPETWSEEQIVTEDLDANVSAN